MTLGDLEHSVVQSFMAGHINRRQFVLQLSALGFSITAIGALLDACGGPTSTTTQPSAKAYTPATPEPGTAIPTVNVTFGMRPYADNTFYVVGMVKGWFKDVGITIQPQPTGLKTTEDQWISLVLNHTVDINSGTGIIALPSYKTSDQIKYIGQCDTFFGTVLFANPKLHLKTVGDYVSTGSNFKQALKQALTPFSGQTVYALNSISEKTFEEVPFTYAGLQLPNYQNLEDAQILLLAKSDRINFCHPGGAPIAESLLEAGWTPVLSARDIAAYGPPGVGSPFESLVYTNGWVSTADYINKNQTTVMRFSSVAFRIFDAISKDVSLYDAYLPYLNSVAGTSLDRSGLKATVENLDPYITFEQQSRYYVDPTLPTYYKNCMGAYIKALEASNTIPKGITPDQMVWAAPMYNEMVQYKTKTDALLQHAQGQQLSTDKQALIHKANQYYGWYDFLDAYRFAQAAVG